MKKDLLKYHLKVFFLLSTIVFTSCTADFYVIRKELDQKPKVIILYNGPEKFFGEDELGAGENFATVFYPEFKKFWVNNDITLNPSGYELLSAQYPNGLEKQWYLPYAVATDETERYDYVLVYDAKKNKYKKDWYTSANTSHSYQYYQIVPSEVLPEEKTILVVLGGYPHRYTAQMYNKAGDLDKEIKKENFKVSVWFVDGQSGKIISEKEGFELFSVTLSKENTDKDLDLFDIILGKDETTRKSYGINRQKALNSFTSKVRELLKNIATSEKD